MSGNEHAAYLKVDVSESDHQTGRTSAPMTLVEFGDYQCPDCGDAHPVVKALIDSLGEDLRVVFRNFPLTHQHEHAQHAAEAAEAAAESGKFWQMHDLLMENQLELTDDDLRNDADHLGLDGGELMLSVLDGRHADRIEADKIGGVRSGVNGTPTFYINGVRWDGPAEFEVMRKALSGVTSPAA